VVSELLSSALGSSAEKATPHVLFRHRHEQDLPFVSIPRIDPIAGSANLAVKRVKDLAKNLVEVDEGVGKDIFPIHWTSITRSCTPCEDWYPCSSSLTRNGDRINVSFTRLSYSLTPTAKKTVRLEPSQLAS
jgi:hypothetical protein